MTTNGKLKASQRGEKGRAAAFIERVIGKKIGSNFTAVCMFYCATAGQFKLLENHKKG